MNLWKTQWPVHEFKVSKAAAEESAGIYYKLVSCVGRTCGWHASLLIFYMLAF